MRKLYIFILAIISAGLLSLLMIDRAEASHGSLHPSIPDDAEHVFLNSCPSAPGSGQTRHGVYPNPSTIPTSSTRTGSTTLNATSILCQYATYNFVGNIVITVTSIVPTNTSATMSIGALPSNFGLGDLSAPPKPKFANPVSKPATMTNLQDGWNCWRVYFYAAATHGGSRLTSGTGSWSVCVYFTPPPPPTVDLKINNSNSPSSILVGGSITASWTSQNATSCSASNQWSGSKALNGSENRNSDSSTSGTKAYGLTCTGAGGSTSDTVSIVVNNPPPTNWNYIPTLVNSGATTSPGSVKSAGESITIVSSVTNTGDGSGPLYSLSVNAFLGSAFVTPATRSFNNQPTLSPQIGANHTASFIVNDDIGNGGEVCFRAVVAPAAGQSTPTLTTTLADRPSAQQFCYTISAPEQPYLEVYGADVWAGGVLATETPLSCINTSAGNNKQIKSNFSASNPLKWSFGQFGVYATGPIVGFGSFGSPTNPNRNNLTFANTTPSSLGNFKNEGVCMTNFYDLLLEGAISPNSTEYLSVGGQRIVTGSITLTGNSSLSQKLILLVNGNVNITGNIQYPNNYSVSNPSQIPLLMIVTTGDINITSGVTRLDGIYVARGDINTCFDKPSQMTITSCSNQLVINGLFMANKINFDRTHGGFKPSKPASQIAPAERFNFSPETYLGLPNFISDYITNLSAQQFKDLPPVY